MSLNAATIEMLISKGLSASDILDVARATEVKKDPTNAERQARHRAKRQSESNAVTVTGVPRENPPYEDTSTPPVPPVEAKASTAPRGRSDRGSKISEDWQAPAIADLPDEARAMAQRWPSSAYRAEAEAFRNYWLGESSAKARKSNWNRAWANRIVAVNSKVLRDAKFSGAGTNTVGRSNGAPMTASQLRSAIAFAEDNNNPDRAAELKAQLERLTARQPPGQVGTIVRQAAKLIQANAA